MQIYFAVDFATIIGYYAAMREQLLKQIKKDLRKMPIAVLARLMKVPYSSFYRIAKDRGYGSVKNWEKIERFYG